MKLNRSKYFLIIAWLLLSILSGCKKEVNNAPPPIINIPVLFNPNLNYGTMTDQEGTTYKTIVIGTQTWMAENLKTTKYRNGDPIPNVTDDNAWIKLTTGAYCDYDNDVRIGKVYGHLYNWYAVSDHRDIAPIGWHVPTDAEWTTLLDYLGGQTAAGNKLREGGTGYWPPPIGSNESGFTALPAAWRAYNGTYGNIGYFAYWWSVTEYDSIKAWARWIYNVPYVNRSHNGKILGYSVRGLKD